MAMVYSLVRLAKLEPGSQTARVKPWLTVILGQVTKRLDFGARKRIGGTASLAILPHLANSLGPQAPSNKLQATSFKHQAPRRGATNCRSDKMLIDTRYGVRRYVTLTQDIGATKIFFKKTQCRHNFIR